MTVTYMFRARQRPVEGLAEVPLAFEPALPTPADPLVLMNRVDAPPPPPPRDVPASAPVTASLPVRYVASEGRIILVAKGRGGIGATTLAVNLAVELQAQARMRGSAAGGRVALVDLDVQLGNAGTFLDLADRGGMLALARLGHDPDAQAVRHAMLSHPSGLQVLAAPAAGMPFAALDALRVGAMLDALADENDVVIVDLPPALIDWLEPVLARAERLLMVTDLAVPSVARAHRVISRLTEDCPGLPVEIVVSQERKPFRPAQVHRDAEAALGLPLRYWLPEESKLARQALDRGEPLVTLAPRCGWSKAVKALAHAMQIPLKTKTATRKDQ